jgi:sensor histidine kinase YesM
MDSVANSKFILSDERKYRIARHVLFWAFWGFYFAMVRELNPKYLKDTGHFPNPAQTVSEAFLMLLPQAILVYPLLYFILPRFVFNGKYIKASLWVLVFLTLTVFANATLLIYIPWNKVAWLSGPMTLFQGVPVMAKWLLAVLAGLQGSLTGAALAASIKMFKHYHLKNLRNVQLQKENTDAQMQLLTAQVHPHFLFNTLNNIYSQTQLESPKGSKMIMGLSELLRYILYEGQKSQVPLGQELMMITEYIALEKIRYSNKLDVHVLLPDNDTRLLIAPLLLLPFVENCFKHGTSKILERPWISLTVEVKGSTVSMKLINGKLPSAGNEQRNNGIGIANVCQRLELLYRNKYELQIKEEEDVFVVDLKVDLVKAEYQKEPVHSPQPEPAYV